MRHGKDYLICRAPNFHLCAFASAASNTYSRRIPLIIISNPTENCPSDYRVEGGWAQTVFKFEAEIARQISNLTHGTWWLDHWPAENFDTPAKACTDHHAEETKWL